MYRRLKTRLSTALLVALAACGGGGTSPNPPGPPPPPPPPPPAPVATVTVIPNTANLLPPQTQALTATTLDASGNPLSGRAVTWTTNAAGVATVSSAGLVTAVGAGSATITATSETKTGTAVITVADGGLVTETGGNVTAAGGNVTMVVPAGAVSGPVSITVTPTTAVPPQPADAWAISGTTYIFGPEGTTFATPVTVTMKYDPAQTPPWAIPSDFGLYHYTGGAWVKFTNITVDPVAHTITGQTTGFSPAMAATGLPHAVITPNPASINFIQRSVVLAASLQGRINPPGLTYAFTTTGNNGALGTQIGGPTDPTIQYTMTQPSLPTGNIDEVRVIVSGQPTPSQPVMPIASQDAVINSNLTLSYELDPEFGHTGFGQTANLDAVVRNPNGSIYTSNNLEYVWKSTTGFGSIDISSPTRIKTSRAVYTALQASQVQHLNPRADKVTVEFWITEDVYPNPNPNGLPPVKTPLLKASVDAFVEVAPKTSFGTFTVRTTPSPGGSCVAAVVLIPKVTGTTSYDVVVTGIIGSGLGTSVHKVVTGPTNTGSLFDVYDAGANLGIPVDAGCATTAGAIAARQTLYGTQYASATILSTVTP